MKAHAPLHRLLDIPSGSAAIKVVDVGANPIDGRPPYAPLLSAGHAQVVGFEPNPAALAELLRKKGPNETYLPYAVGDGRQHTLRLCQASGMTSLLEPNEQVLSLFHGFSQWGRVLRTEEIDTVRLDDIPETEGLDYLKIDIQGAELMVFESAPRRLSEALIIHTEVEFLPLYKQQPLFSDVEAFLRGRGFILHRFEELVSRAMKPVIINNNPYSQFRQVMWTDAIFVRSFLDLAALGDAALLKLSIILHDCYRSYDLVHVLLSERDRRTGQRLGETYLSALTA